MNDDDNNNKIGQVSAKDWWTVAALVALVFYSRYMGFM